MTNQPPAEHNPSGIQLRDQVKLLGNASDGTVMVVTRIFENGNNEWVAHCIWSNGERTISLMGLEKYNEGSFPPGVILG